MGRGRSRVSDRPTEGLRIVSDGHRSEPSTLMPARSFGERPGRLQRSGRSALIFRQVSVQPSDGGWGVDARDGGSGRDGEVHPAGTAVAAGERPGSGGDGALECNGSRDVGTGSVDPDVLDTLG